ncbi:MAG: hypothetical protein HYV02_05280 [Deltaproteobacteria bacterium]|nr:hypothetical protein [Deltaproteobacteria bacterium]
METQHRIITLGLIACYAACQAVNSSELAETKASELRLEGVITEYNETTQTKVSAQMQTMVSEVGISFNQGESLTAATDTADGISTNVALGLDGFFDIDKFYEGTLGKTVSGGNYYLTYTDHEGTKTVATIATSDVPDLITPAENAVIGTESAEVTWDPGTISDGLVIQVLYADGSVAGLHQESVQNTGQYSFDLSGVSGTGSLSLIHTTLYTSMSGFGEAGIQMKNVSKRNVSFAQPASTSKSLAGALVDAEMTPTTAEEIVEARLHQCLHFCDAGEIDQFTVAGEEYSCCIEE